MYITDPGLSLTLTGVTMASFGGHAIPGSFFLLYGFWLTVKHILQHYWRTNQPKGRGIIPPFFKKMNYFEGGFAVFASLVGQFPFWSVCMLKLLKTCPLIAAGLLLFRLRYFGWTVRSKRSAGSPLRHSQQFVGQADELAAQHHVSVFWDLWDNIDCQYCIQTGASRRWLPCSLLGSFCWRWAVQKQGFDFPLPHGCSPLTCTATLLPCFQGSCFTTTCTVAPLWMLTSTPCCWWPYLVGQPAPCWRCSSDTTLFWSFSEDVC